MARQAIGLFLRSLENDYQRRLRDDAAAVGARLGFEITVQSAQNDSARQCAQIAEALAGGAAAPVSVLVSPVFDDALADLAAAAARAGTGWVLLNREAGYLQRLRDEAQDLSCFAVTPDQSEIGRLQGRQAKALLRGGGAVLAVTGPAEASSARLRREGLDQELGAEGWTVTRVEADWTSEGARLAVDTWLGGDRQGAPAPALVCAQNDAMALGARQALRDGSIRLAEAALAEIPITGCDGSPSYGQRLVKEGRLRATIDVPSAAGAALEWLARARDGGGRPPLQVILPVSSYPPLGALGQNASSRK